MSPETDLEDELAVERLLRRGRPRPEDQFVQATERRLLGRPAQGRRRRRVLAAGFGLSGALATALVLAALAGSGPLAKDGGTPAAARDRCKTVSVTVHRRVGEIVRDATGQTKVVYRVRPVTRSVKRCR